MKWFVEILGSSIGKKLLMAITGACFLLFLVAHLAGNLTLYGGSEAFISYAEHLHSLGPLITVFELGLLLLAVVHVFTGTLLFLQNRRARTTRYAANARAGGRTIGSSTMPYTGFIILLFVILHLMQFHFVDKTHTTIWHIVAGTFQNPIFMVLYILAMVVVAVHVSHGFWSLFQTLGANHPKYMPTIMLLAVAVSVIFAIGFGFLPIYVALAA